MAELTGTVLRIERISLNDGPGLRTVVFLKGCPLRCLWCSAPESQAPDPEPYYRAERCTRCGKCVQACAQGALRLYEGEIRCERSLCRSCGRCAEVCPAGARGIYGKRMTVGEVMREIEKDSVFYFHSGGGVTLSGGDVLLQAEFAAAILRECREIGLNTAAELDMFGKWENAEKLLGYLDSFYADVKTVNAEKHRRFTGADIGTVLDNIRRADAFLTETGRKGPVFTLRVPLVPGLNDTAEELAAVAAFAGTLRHLTALEFLPYHRLGLNAYASLGRTYALRDLPALSREQAKQTVLTRLGQQTAFPVLIAGERVL